MTDSAHTRIRRTRRPVLASAAALSLTAFLAVGVGSADATTRVGSAVATTSDATPPCPLASAAPLTLQYPDQAPSAGPVLRRLANRPRSSPSDADTGRYAYAQVRMRAADSTFEGRCIVTVTAYADEQRWRADDGSGQVTGTPWHHDPAHPPAAETTTYPAGGLPGVVAGPVPSDPAALAAVLDAAFPPIQVAAAQARPMRVAENQRQCRHPGTAARVRAIAELNAWHYVNRPARRASLLVLADVQRLAYRGTVAGYPGAIAVSVDTGDWRDVLVIDPRTGVVRAYEQVLLRNGETTLGVRAPYMNARTAYTGRGRTSRIG